MMGRIAWCGLLAVRFDHPLRGLPTPHFVSLAPILRMPEQKGWLLTMRFIWPDFAFHLAPASS